GGSRGRALGASPGSTESSRPARRVDLRRLIEDVQRFGIAAALVEVARQGTAHVGEIDVMAMLLQEICGLPKRLVGSVSVLERQCLCEGGPGQTLLREIFLAEGRDRLARERLGFGSPVEQRGAPGLVGTQTGEIERIRPRPEQPLRRVEL